MNQSDGSGSRKPGGEYGFALDAGSHPVGFVAPGAGHLLYARGIRSYTSRAGRHRDFDPSHSGAKTHSIVESWIARLFADGAKEKESEKNKTTKSFDQDQA
jgi:hypothetical protein